jgi:hypothetical protein
MRYSSHAATTVLAAAVEQEKRGGGNLICVEVEAGTVFVQAGFMGQRIMLN